MTADELIERLNKNERISAVIDDDTIHVFGEGHRVLMVLNIQDTNFFDLYIDHEAAFDCLGKGSRDYVCNQIAEYLQTPIEKRKSEKKYALAWARDDNGQSNYFVKHNGGWFLVNKRSDQLPDEILFTQRELDQIGKKCSYMKPIIEALKVEV